MYYQEVAEEVEDEISEEESEDESEVSIFRILAAKKVFLIQFCVLLRNVYTINKYLLFSCQCCCQKVKGPQGIIQTENPNLVKPKNLKARDVDVGY